MNRIRPRTVVLLAIAVFAGRVGAQAPDPATRLRQVLPADVAERVLARAADARQHHLPGEALEERALKFAARGVPAAAIEKAVDEQAERMARVQSVLRDARAQAPARDEIEAGAEALREGVDASSIAALARSAPSGRSLSVPLFVMGNLATHGTPAADALRLVSDRLQARASDADLERLPDESVARGGQEDSRDADARPATAPENGRHGADHPMPRPAAHAQHPVAHGGRRP